MPVHHTAKQKLLVRAVALVGRELLAAKMRVSPTQLDALASGESEMSDGKLIRLSEILDEYAKE